jgi:hypothetical protein
MKSYRPNNTKEKSCKIISCFRGLSKPTTHIVVKRFQYDLSKFSIKSFAPFSRDWYLEKSFSRHFPNFSICLSNGISNITYRTSYLTHETPCFEIQILFHFDFSSIMTHDNKRGFTVNYPIFKKIASSSTTRIDTCRFTFYTKTQYHNFTCCSGHGEPNPCTFTSPGRARRTCHPVPSTPVHATSPTPTFFCSLRSVGLQG